MRIHIEEYCPALDRFMCREPDGDLHAVEIGDSFDYEDGNELVGREVECDVLVPLVERPHGGVRLMPLDSATKLYSVPIKFILTGGVENFEVEAVDDISAIFKASIAVMEKYGPQVQFYTEGDAREIAREDVSTLASA